MIVFVGVMLLKSILHEVLWIGEKSYCIFLGQNEKENLFRMCSVVTNLVTPLEFKPTRCATTLCHFRWTRNGSVATQFILLSSTAESSATNGNVVVLERFGQSKPQASSNEERTRKKTSFCCLQWI